MECTGAKGSAEPVIEWKKINKEKILQTDKVQWPCWQVSQHFFRKHLVGMAQVEADQRVVQYLPIKMPWKSRSDGTVQYHSAKLLYHVIIYDFK